MTQYTYTIDRDLGMHFGPAARLAEIARVYPDTKATISMGKRMMNIVSSVGIARMGIRKGDDVTIKAEGPSEVEVMDVINQYLADMCKA